MNSKFKLLFITLCLLSLICLVHAQESSDLSNEEIINNIVLSESTDENNESAIITDEELEAAKKKRGGMLKRLGSLFNRNDVKKDDSNYIDDEKLAKELKKEEKNFEKYSKKLAKDLKKEGIAPEEIDNIIIDLEKERNESTFGPEAVDFEEIIAIDSEKNTKKAKKFFKQIGFKLNNRKENIKSDLGKEYRQTLKDGSKDIATYDVKYEINLNSLQYTKFKFGVRHNLLDPKYILHDINKIYGDVANANVNNWNEFKFRTVVAFPFTFSISSPLPISFGYSLRAGTEYEYKLITKAKSIFSENNGIWTSAIGKIKDTWAGVKSLRVPLTANGFLKSTQAGDEVIKRGRSYIQNTVSANFPIYQFISFSNSASILTQADFTKRVQNISIGDKTLLRLNVKRNKKITESISNSIRVGMTLLDFKVPVTNNFLNKVGVGEVGAKAVLSLSILSHSLGNTNAQDLEMDYTYDLSFPEAVVAFNHAYLGDFRKTEKIAITRSLLPLYKGVHLNHKKSDVYQTFYNNIFFGFKANDTDLKTDLLTFKLDEKFGNFLEISSRVSKTKHKINRKSFIRDLGEVQKFTYTKDFKKKVILGLFANMSKSVTVDSKLINTEVNAPEGLKKIKTSIIDYTYVLKQKKFGYRRYKHFFGLASFSFGTNNPVTQASINSYLGSNACKKDMQIVLKAKWMGEVVNKLSKLNKEELWSAFAAFFGLEVGALATKEKKKDILNYISLTIAEYRSHKVPAEYKVSEAKYNKLKV
ncbi:MAG: hypothetical protein ACI9QD_000771, partial [Thermoproteota archaeon]